MDPLRFAQQGFLALLWLLPLLGWLHWRARSRREEALRVWAADGTRERLLAGVDLRRRRHKAALIVAAIALLAIAAARPQLGVGVQEATHQGIDLVVALDTSLSMQAADIKPNRLEKAKHEVAGLIDRLEGDRIGLLPFAGVAFPYCPLTPDYAGARMFLNAVEPGFIPQPGTALAGAIRSGLEMLEQAEAADDAEYDRAILLVTDGEGHDTGLLEAARAAKEAGVPVYAVGIGTPEAEPIPVYDQEGGHRGYKRGADGKTVLSRLNEPGLREVAEITGGRYWRATTGELELGRLYRELSGLRERRIGSREFRVYEERFQWPLALAVLLLLAELLLPETPGRRKSAVALTVTLALLPALLCGFGPWVTAASKCREGNRLYQQQKFAEAAQAYEEGRQLDSSEPRLKFNLGAALYQQQQWARAAEQFDHTAEKLPEEHQASAHYDLGNCQYRTGRYDQAAESYRRALRLDPSARDAKHNLELALKKLEEQQQQQESSDDDQQQENDDQQQPQEDQDQQPQQQPDQQEARQDEQQAQQQQAEEQQAQQQQAQEEQQAQPMTREEALQLLRAAQQGDEELQQMLLRAPETREPVPGGKDW